MIAPKALLAAVPGSVRKPKRQTRSAASAHVGESTASTAQMSTARLIANSPLRLCFRLSTLYDDMRNVCVGCAPCKGGLSSGCKPHPATAPAGSNRSSHGGDEMAEAFD